jgi:hypothetical protein
MAALPPRLDCVPNRLPESLRGHTGCAREGLPVLGHLLSGEPDVI